MKIYFSSVSKLPFCNTQKKKKKKSTFISKEAWQARKDAINTKEWWRRYLEVPAPTRREIEF